MAKRLLVLFALLTFGLMIAGCSEGDKSNTVVNPNPDVFAHTGSISGVVMDDCANTPVQGAVVAVAYSGSVKKVTMVRVTLTSAHHGTLASTTITATLTSRTILCMRVDRATRNAGMAGAALAMSGVVLMPSPSSRRSRSAGRRGP